MKKIFSVNCTTCVNSESVFSSANYSEALRYFECEKERLSLNTPADTSGWGDNDKAWLNVYFIELIDTMIDEEGYVIDMITLTSTNYYYI